MSKALIKRAIAKYKSQGKLATACNVTQTAIWLAKESGHCSAELAMGIEKAMAGEITARQLRPDLPWPEPVSAPSSQGDGDTGGRDAGSLTGPNSETAESPRAGARADRGGVRAGAAGG